jgi:hypothetical protein
VHTSLDKYPGSFKEGVSNHCVCMGLDEYHFTQNQPTEEETLVNGTPREKVYPL